MPRYVLLYHDCPPRFVRPSHWDLMLELGDVLETWALAELPHDWQAAYARTAEAYPSCPPLANGNVVEAEHLAGHRLAFLEYEGPLTGDRGEVLRVAAGTYLASQTQDVWEVTIDVGPLSGGTTLQRELPDLAHWRLTYRPAENR